jgi:hypothetical protein
MSAPNGTLFQYVGSTELPLTFLVQVTKQLNMSMKMAVFWDVAPCSLVEIDQRFRRLYCLHHHVDVGLLGCDVVWTCKLIPAFRKNILLPSSESLETQKTNIDIYTAVKTSDLIQKIIMLKSAFFE